MKQRKTKVSILSYPETGAALLYGYHDIFASAGVVWPFQITGAPGAPLFDTQIVAASKEPFAIYGDVLVAPHASLEEVGTTDLILIPEIDAPLDGSPHGRLQREIAWLQDQYAAGATIASSCSGSLLLAETGLLNGQEATTHWGLESYFSKHYPAVTVRADRVLCFAGEDDRLVTAGGHALWHDLAIYLISRFCGNEEAIRTAKMFLLAPHTNGQLPFAGMVRRPQRSDAVIEDCQSWISENYAEEQPVAGMIRRSGLPPRTFARRFKLATGYQPLEYVQALRVEEAKQLIETCDLPVDEIGQEVGYDDPSYFRRLFKRKAGLSPAAYRKTFVGTFAFGPHKP